MAIATYETVKEAAGPLLAVRNAANSLGTLRSFPGSPAAR